jgi:hypothetical protein
MFELNITAVSADLQTADIVETNTLIWRGEQAPALPITIQRRKS